MESYLGEALKLKFSPVAIILTDEKPEQGLHFKEGAWGCVGSMLIAASKGRSAYFDSKTFGCAGGGVGLGFGGYGQFPIEYLLSTGNQELAEKMGGNPAIAEGERFFKSPGVARKVMSQLPMTRIPAAYVVFKPLDQLEPGQQPKLVIFFVNPDQLSALVVLAGYDHENIEASRAPFGAACQSIIFGYEEDQQDQPQGIIGFFDISQRTKVDPDILSYTVPYKMYLRLEGNARGSFLDSHAWHEVRERI
ncbi:MAG TPA: DUF169 domain-containing protein [Bacillota bacterium]|nr:DUF169 domain-containing protein [Bacillota bacterium]